MATSRAEQAVLTVTDQGEWRLSGPLTLDGVAGVYQHGQRLIAEGRPVKTVNLSDISTADSGGLALLLEWATIAEAGGSTLEVRGLPARLETLIRLSGAQNIFRIQVHGEPHSQAASKDIRPPTI